jgi:rfaE bifunctional protein nucleotidyltransferase chain/domain
MMRGMNFREKILTWQTLPAWREGLRTAQKQLVVTNGCFDILHLGHVTYLEAARNLGDALLVGLNSDASVRAIKGAGRPINSQEDRATVLAALASVNAVCVFGESDAMSFLQKVKPDLYVKGGDYTIDTIHQPERRLVERMGGRVVVLAGVPGKSTSWLLDQLEKRDPPSG